MDEIPDCMDCASCGVQFVPGGSMNTLETYCEENSPTFPHRCNKYVYQPGVDVEEMEP